MRVWFNRTFSSLHGALSMIKQGDPDRVYTLVYSASDPHPAICAECDEVLPEPADLKGEAYVDWCVETARQQHIDIFVPGREARLISAAAERFGAVGVRVLSAGSSNTLEALDDKAHFYQDVDCSAAPAPDFVACSTLAEFDLAIQQIVRNTKEVCIKPAQSVFGIGFRRIRTDRSAYDILMSANPYSIDLHTLRHALSRRTCFPAMLVMEYLNGPEFSVDCLADQGRIVVAVPRRKEATRQIIDAREDIQDACRQIIAQFSLNGFINIQFREGEKGLRVLEVNTRMSGGIAMAAQAGVNLPYLGLRGFDKGYATLQVPQVRFGTAVFERNVAGVILS